MKTTYLTMIAAALLLPFSAAAGERRSTGSDSGMGANHRDPSFKQQRVKIGAEIAELQREIDLLSAAAAAEGREKIDALKQRADELETRVASAAEGGDREWKETRHKFKNELKKLRRELKNARKAYSRAQQGGMNAPEPVYP